jgi:preprotein translocase subunit YajC
VFAADGSSFLLQFLTLFLPVFLVMYFLIIRPQMKRQKAREALLKQVGKGDRILTNGGLFGTIVSTRGDEVIIVQIADNVRVEMARPAVASIVERKSGE